MSKNGELDFNDYFFELAQRVHYIKLTHFEKGIPWFKHLQPTLETKKNIVLRGKSGIKATGEKMGIDPS